MNEVFDDDDDFSVSDDGERTQESIDDENRLKELADEAEIMLARMETMTLEASKIKDNRLVNKKMKLKLSYVEDSLKLMNESFVSKQDGSMSSTHYYYDVKDDENNRVLSPVYSAGSFAGSNYSPSSPCFQDPKSPSFYSEQSFASGGTDAGGGDFEHTKSMSEASGMGGAAKKADLPQPPPPIRRVRGKAVVFEEASVDPRVQVYVGKNSKVLHHLRCPHTPNEPPNGSVISFGAAMAKNFRMPKHNGGCCRNKFVASLIVK